MKTYSFTICRKPCSNNFRIPFWNGNYDAAYYVAIVRVTK